MQKSHLIVVIYSLLMVLLPLPGMNQVDQKTYPYSALDSIENRQIIKALNFKDSDIKDVIRTIATAYNLNIVIDQEVNEKITLHLSDVGVLDVIYFIADQNNLRVEKIGRIYKISKPPLPPQSLPPPKIWDIDYKNGLLSVDFKNEDIGEVIYEISKRSGKTIFPDRSTSGQISGYFKELPFEEALHYLFKNNGFQLIKEGEVYQVRRTGYRTSEETAVKHNFWIHMHNNLLDLEASNVSIPVLLKEVAYQTDINFFLYDDIKGTVTLQSKGLTIETFLNLILSSYEYTYKKSGNIYLIGLKENKMLVSSKLIRLNHLKVDAILNMLPQKSLEKAEYKIIKEHNAILINGSQDIIAEVEEIIRRLDRPIPQILIDVLVVDYNYQDIRELSVEAGLTGGGIDSGYSSADKWFPEVDFTVGGHTVNKYLNRIGNYFGVTNIGQLPDDFYLTVKALEKTGKANIRSKPQIATLNGYPADITIGQTQYYILKTQTPIRDPSQVYIQETQQFHTIEANITVQITPWVSASGEITVEIHPEFNNPVGQFTAEVPPTIQRRALNSTVRLQDGETILLGGLIQSAETETISKFPILGRIPLIGRLFQNKNHQKTKSELIIYVTPHLTYGDELLMEG